MLKNINITACARIIRGYQTQGNEYPGFCVCACKHQMIKHDKAHNQDTKVHVSAVSVKEQRRRRTVIERRLEEHADKIVQNARKQAYMQTKHTTQKHTRRRVLETKAASLQ